MNVKKEWSSSLEEFLAKSGSLGDRNEYPSVTIVIPTYNCSQWIGYTLKSIASQTHPDVEVVIVDASSTDRTLEIIRSYRLPHIHIYSVAKPFFYEMINRGIALATGVYVNILFPGDFFLSHEALAYMATAAVKNNAPDLVYCGSMLHDINENSAIMLNEFTLDLLRVGGQPTSIKACWFRSDTLKRIGKIDTRYSLRGGYDIMCRYLLDPNVVILGIKRILTDYEGYMTTHSSITRHFIETMQIIRRYFGTMRAMRWMVKQRIVRSFFLLWIRKMKQSFFRT